MTGRVCKTCGVEKPPSEFYKVKSGRRVNYRGVCKECYRPVLRAYNTRTTALPSRKASRQRAKMLQRYGLTETDYDSMLRRQNGVCAICRQSPKWRLVIDHCHTTGRVRGLLCGGCNTGIGQLRDDPVLVRAAASYLETA
jgi:hypothetical protein